MEIKVYTKSACPFCDMTKKWFDENGFEYETILMDNEEERLAFYQSINGIKETSKEHSFILELIGGLFLIPFLIFIETDYLIKILIIVIYFLLLAFELINTSIEKLSDKIKKDFDPDIKIIKDISSGAVFVVLIILIFLIIFSLL